MHTSDILNAYITGIRKLPPYVKYVHARMAIGEHNVPSRCAYISLIGKDRLLQVCEVHNTDLCHTADYELLCLWRYAHSRNELTSMSQTRHTCPGLLTADCEGCSLFQIND